MYEMAKSQGNTGNWGAPSTRSFFENLLDFGDFGRGRWRDNLIYLEPILNNIETLDDLEKFCSTFAPLFTSQQDTSKWNDEHLKFMKFRMDVILEYTLSGVSGFILDVCLLEDYYYNYGERGNSYYHFVAALGSRTHPLNREDECGCLACSSFCGGGIYELLRKSDLLQTFRAEHPRGKYPVKLEESALERMRLEDNEPLRQVVQDQFDEVLQIRQYGKERDSSLFVSSEGRYSSLRFIDFPGFDGLLHKIIRECPIYSGST